MTKTCKKCKVIKNINDFYKNKSKKDGIDIYCKNCRRSQVKSATNKDKQSENFKKWYKNNKDEHQRKRNIYQYNRRREDPMFKLKGNLRGRLYSAMRFHGKTGSAIRDLGCSIDELRIYLESKFEPGMTWDNYGRKGWHIDHIIPLSSFDLTNPKDVKKACHFTNLQPLWWSQNLKKSNKL